MFDQQSAIRYQNSIPLDTPVIPNLEKSQYNIVINKRNFFITVTASPLNLFTMHFSQGNTRTIDVLNYTYTDTFKGNPITYSIASLKEKGKIVNSNNLFNNLTYLCMFTDYSVANKLNTFGSNELNTIVDFIMRRPKRHFKITSPSKNITNVLIYNMSSNPAKFYTVENGKPLDNSTIKLIDYREEDDRGNLRTDLPVMRQLIKQRQYNCWSQQGSRQFLEDLGYIPSLSGCHYQSEGTINM